MNQLHFENLNAFWMLWGIPVLIGFFIYASWCRRQALERFAEAKLLPLLNVSIDHVVRRWKLVMLLVAIGFVIIGSSRPSWSSKPKKVVRTGRDVVFVLDVSRSMLARDLVPNRLERAKLAIKDCIAKLEGDRIGLLVFAGNSAVKCPLTQDYGFFTMMLDDVSPDSVGRGGTMIGDAMRKVLKEVFDDQRKEFKDVILITDGEDHESFPLEAAQEVGKRGIRIIAIGIGDEHNGKRIPVLDEQGRETFLKDRSGKEVWTKLDGDTLRKMVNSTPGGRYLNVATGTFDLGEVYLKLVASADQKKLETQTIKRYEERFQIFIGIAIVLLLAELIISERRKSKGNSQIAPHQR